MWGVQNMRDYCGSGIMDGPDFWHTHPFVIVSGGKLAILQRMSPSSLYIHFECLIFLNNVWLKVMWLNFSVSTNRTVGWWLVHQMVSVVFFNFPLSQFVWHSGLMDYASNIIPKLWWSSRTLSSSALLFVMHD